MNVLNACKDNCKFKGGKSGREGQGGIKPDFFGGGGGERRGESRLGRLMGIREREKKNKQAKFDEFQYFNSFRSQNCCCI